MISTSLYRAAVFAELLLPFYARFSKEEAQADVRLLMHAMDRIWAALLEGASIDDMKSEDFIALAPDTEDFFSRFTSRALDACTSLATLIKAVQGREPAAEG